MYFLIWGLAYNILGKSGELVSPGLTPSIGLIPEPLNLVTFSLGNGTFMNMFAKVEFCLGSVMVLPWFLPTLLDKCFVALPQASRNACSLSYNNFWLDCHN